MQDIEQENLVIRLPNIFNKEGNTSKELDKKEKGIITCKCTHSS
jgi:hypothetical protein